MVSQADSYWSFGVLFLASAVQTYGTKSSRHAGHRKKWNQKGTTALANDAATANHIGSTATNDAATAVNSISSTVKQETGWSPINAPQAAQHLVLSSASLVELHDHSDSNTSMYSALLANYSGYDARL